MSRRKSPSKLRITLEDFILANKKAAREEEIAQFGRPVSSRTLLHKSRKIYDRKRMKKVDLE